MYALEKFHVPMSGAESYLCIGHCSVIRVQSVLREMMYRISAKVVNYLYFKKAKIIHSSKLNCNSIYQYLLHLISYILPTVYVSTLLIWYL